MRRHYFIYWQKNSMTPPLWVRAWTVLAIPYRLLRYVITGELAV